jgi:hypothetical protein
MRCIVALAMLTIIMLPYVASAAEVETARGAVSWVSPDAVEVGGRRGLVTPATSITSEGREISIASVVVGMPAELEIDAGGRALELRVQGAVE